VWAFGKECFELEIQSLLDFKRSLKCGFFDSLSKNSEIKLKSLILAQIERWRHALHMQVERQHGSNLGGEWRTGE
jgi:hypothetical protein